MPCAVLTHGQTQQYTYTAAQSPYKKCESIQNDSMVSETKGWRDAQTLKILFRHEDLTLIPGTHVKDMVAECACNLRMCWEVETVGSV